MDYKRIIKNKKTRIRILEGFDFIPDTWMVKAQYRIKTGHRLNLNNPRRFTEKIQWYKLFYRDSRMQRCANKVLAREYVEECGLEEILTTLFGVYSSAEEIDFEKLPDRYVIKDSLGAGGNEVIIVEDNSRIDVPALRKKLCGWVTRPIAKKHIGREWVYAGQEHRILIEELLLPPKGQKDLVEYKLFCFNGKVEYAYIISERKLGENAALAIIDADFKRIPAQRKDERPLLSEIEKPNNWNELVKIAEKLSIPFPQVRVDMYDIDGRIVFGEFTFFDGSGYMKFEPDEFDYMLGEKWTIGN